MSAMRNFTRLALRPIVEGACEAVGAHVVSGAAGAAVDFLVERFSDHSDKLHEKLEKSILRTWTALEVALAGESFWERCRVKLARGEDQGFRKQLQAFLAAIPDDRLPLPRDAFRQQCLAELRAARKAGLLAGVPHSAQQLAEDASVFARFGDTRTQLQSEMKVLDSLADDFRTAGYANLALLVASTDGGTPLVVVLVRYFFRREIEEDHELFQSLAWSQAENLSEQQRQGFAAVEQLVVSQGRQLTDMLAEVQAVVEETHAAVLDVRQELQDQGKQNRALYDAVLTLQKKLDIQQREVRPRDSLSIRNEQERQLIKDVIARYRALPQDERQEMPALLNAIGQLEVAAGSFEAAEKDFAAVATLVDDGPAKAEAHHNAYRAALERRAWDSALTELREALRLDPKRFSPFPVEKYIPQRILGAGGFGVAILCKHKFTGGHVVVKTLLDSELQRDLEQLFSEAQALQQLNHPSIIGLKDCGYTDEVNNTRPYLVMDYFEGATLEQYVKEMGALNQRELVPLATKMAEALLAAHQKGILHRDFKPGNLLVRFAGTGWDIKLIDFGLALKEASLRDTSKTGRTLIGGSIAGTLDYAAPEQMGKLPGVSVGPYSDVYGFGKTCCYALFGTTQPVLKHWQSIPEPLADLLGRCLGEKPDDRPTDFTVIMRSLQRLPAQMNPAPVLVVEVEPPAAPRPAPRSERPSRPHRAAEPPRRETRPEPARPAPRRRGWRVGPILLVVLVLALPLGLFFGLKALLTRPILQGGPPDPNWPNFGGWPGGGTTGGTNKPPEATVKDPDLGRVYLTSLTPTKKSEQAPVWSFGPAGKLGNGSDITLAGWRADKGLSIGPPAYDNPMFIEYDVPQGEQPCLLQMMVGLDDSSGTDDKQGVTFDVVGDDNPMPLWRSKLIRKTGQYDECRINLAGVKRLKVRYKFEGPNDQAFTRPVWVNPYLIPIDKSSLDAKTPDPAVKPPTNEAKKKYLDELTETSSVVGEEWNKKWVLGKGGLLGDPANTRIKVNEREVQHGLGLHATNRDAWASVRYRLDGKATALKTAAAINDTGFRGAIFTVWGDGKMLWTSGPVDKGKPVECLVDLRGVKELELRTRSSSPSFITVHSVWIDPLIYLEK